MFRINVSIFSITTFWLFIFWRYGSGIELDLWDLKHTEMFYYYCGFIFSHIVLIRLVIMGRKENKGFITLAIKSIFFALARIDAMHHDIHAIFEL
ncbi:MAG: hypothetical protein IPJ43_06350 [Saprospiraceae bacterium]|nr:hypothetical protein [Saprospiraceae bacterium]